VTVRCGFPRLGVTLTTDLAEPRQWRQARLDALNALEQRAQGTVKLLVGLVIRVYRSRVVRRF
jgi:hypothetical protein